MILFSFELSSWDLQSYVKCPHRQFILLFLFDVHLDIWLQLESFSSHTQLDTKGLDYNGINNCKKVIIFVPLTFFFNAQIFLNHSCPLWIIVCELLIYFSSFLNSYTYGKRCKSISIQVVVGVFGAVLGHFQYSTM